MAYRITNSAYSNNFEIPLPRRPSGASRLRETYLSTPLIHEDRLSTNLL